MNDTNYRFAVAYESISLDVGETLKGRLPYIRRVIAMTRKGARQKQQETGHPHRLMVGIDVIGKSQQEGARAIAATFKAVVDSLKPSANIYVAWNPHDEPRYARDMFVRGRETAPPDVYALRINGLVESAGIDLSEMTLFDESRGAVE
ncbi:MAG: hypothetical protein GY832_06115 [Chloroflexi bacterium]|nr:hypothetical protein [Chloroflexota bacterium]